jgi:hypothetical protein
MQASMLTHRRIMPAPGRSYRLSKCLTPELSPVFGWDLINIISLQKSNLELLITHTRFSGVDLRPQDRDFASDTRLIMSVRTVIHFVSNVVNQKMQRDRRCNIRRGFKTTRCRFETGSIFRRTIASPGQLRYGVRGPISPSLSLSLSPS